MMFSIRLLFCALVRFAALMILWLFLPRVTFLPGWLLNVCAYILYFLLTYALVVFVMRHHEASMRRTLITLGVFVVVELFVPFFVHIFIGNGRAADMLGIFRLETIFLLVLYLFAGLMARDHLKVQIAEQQTPEGLGT
jgi:hypothetical protein